MDCLENGAARALDAISRIAREVRDERDPAIVRQAVAQLAAECMGYWGVALGITDSQGILEFTVVGEASYRQHEKACGQAPALAPDGSWVSAPLAGTLRPVGILVGYAHGAGAFDQDDLRLHSQLCECLAVILEAWTTAADLAQALHQDPVTGLYSRRHLLRRIDEELSRTQRYGGQFALVFLDIVGLRRINAVFGHSMGDAVIEAVSEVLRRSFRGSDVAARFGDDEFAVLLPGADKSRGQVVANRISRMVQCIAIERDGVRMQGPDLDWCVVSHPADGSTRDQLLAAREDAAAP